MTSVDATEPMRYWSTLFVRDRRLLSLTLCLIVVSGLAAFMVLPRMEDPQLTQRAGIVNTLFPGASAERVESLVTDKIEAEIQEVEEIKELRSTSRDGISTIIIELKDSVLAEDADNVWSRIRDKLGDATTQLPDNALAPEFDKLKITAYALIVGLSWEMDSAPNYAILRRYAAELDDRLRAIHGTKEVELFGDPAEEILVTLNQEELIERKLTISDVANQLRASDAKVSAGVQRGREGDLLLEMAGEMDSVSRVRETPIQLGPGSQAVELGDLATVERAIRTPLGSMAMLDGKDAVVLGAIVMPTTRVDTWFDDVRGVLEEFETNLPAGIKQRVRFEQDTYVRGRLTQLSKNLLLGALAVMLVITVMMGWRSALVVGVALPLASLMVLAGLNWMKIPLHQMSITGLIIALGLLIDNAIVMVDEVGQQIRDGATPYGAVHKSVSHLAVPLFGSTLTTALSFAPIALMPGPAGEFVGSIAISVLLAIFSSFALAMTVTPALAAIVQPTRQVDPQRRRWFRQGLRSERLTQTYAGALRWLYGHPWYGVLGSMLLPILGFLLGTTLTEQFFPPADRDQINIQMDLTANSSIANTRSVVEQARSIMMNHQEVVAVDWYLGESAPSFYYNMLANRRGVSQYAQALVQLRDADEARPLILQLQNELNRALPNARFLVRQLEQGPPFEAPIEIRLFGPDLERLRHLGNEVRQVLAATPDVVHVTTELGDALPTIQLDVDEEKSRLIGINRTDIAEQLAASLEGAVGGFVLESTETMPIRVRTADLVRGDLDQIVSLQVLARTSTGETRAVPLSNLATARLVPKIPAIQRFNTQRMNEIKGYITAGMLPADVLSNFQERLDASGFQLPPGYRFRYAGEASKRDEAVGNLMSSVGVLLVLMVATLVLSFSSYRIAAVIGAVALLSVGLSLGALTVFGYPFGFMAIVGTMGLIGVAINDTIVVLAAIRENELARQGDLDELCRVVVKSTRHVLATTLTTIAGFIPLLVQGGGFWPPLATAIAGGVSGATILALFFGPSCYVLGLRIKRRRS